MLGNISEYIPHHVLNKNLIVLYKILTIGVSVYCSFVTYRLNFNAFLYEDNLQVAAVCLSKLSSNGRIFGICLCFFTLFTSSIIMECNNFSLCGLLIEWTLFHMSRFWFVEHRISFFMNHFHFSEKLLESLSYIVSIFIQFDTSLYE